MDRLLVIADLADLFVKLWNGNRHEQNRAIDVAGALKGELRELAAWKAKRMKRIHDKET